MDWSDGRIDAISQGLHDHSVGVGCACIVDCSLYGPPSALRWGAGRGCSPFGTHQSMPKTEKTGKAKNTAARLRKAARPSSTNISTKKSDQSRWLQSQMLTAPKASGVWCQGREGKEGSQANGRTRRYSAMCRAAGQVCVPCARNGRHALTTWRSRGSTPACQLCERAPRSTPRAFSPCEARTGAAAARVRRQSSDLGFANGNASVSRDEPFAVLLDCAQTGGMEGADAPMRTHHSNMSRRRPNAWW